ncbi:MAG: response regulator transcription factor [Ferruginibacter sp.]
MKKILLVDDHSVIRSGIKGILKEVCAPCEVSEAADGDTATEALKKQHFDMIMMDIQIPGTDSLGMMEYIHVKYPAAKVLVFSTSSEKIYAKRFLKAGAKGFLSKQASLDEIKKAINLVLNDRVYISDALSSTLVEESFSITPNNPFEKLSAREFEIATLLLAGNTISTISKSLNLQVSTVGTHKARVFDKLNVSNLLDLKDLAQAYLM